jgi:hypothetical protein
VKQSDRFGWALNSLVGMVFGAAAITMIGTTCNPAQQPWQAGGLAVLSGACFLFGAFAARKALTR